MVSRSDQTQIQQHLLIVRKLVLDIRYYQNHRAEFEEDRSADCIFLAEANLKNVERILERYNKR